MKISKKIIYSLLIFALTIFTILVSTDVSQSVALYKEKKLPIYSVDTDEKSIALSFDINWAERDYLLDILQVLDKYDVKATFFIMGGWVNYSQENVEKLVKIKEGGHEIGNHSYIHPMFTQISLDRIQEEIDKTEKVFLDTIGSESKLFRFPSGDFNDIVIDYMEKIGYKCLQWNVDSVDYKESGEKIEYERVINKVKPGSILLFHNNAKYTPVNLEKIIINLRNEGYDFKIISDLIYDENSYIDQNGIQHKNNY